MCEYNYVLNFRNDMEATEANMEIKVIQLEMTMMKTNAVLERGKHEATERHLSTLKHLSSEVNRMRLDVEAAKWAAKEEITALQEWNDRLDAKLEKADSDVERLTTWLDDRRKEKEAHGQEQKLHFKAKLHQTKLDMQAELTNNTHRKSRLWITVKLNYQS